jgi:hypothetical protein
VVAGIYAFARRNYVSIVLATGLKEVDWVYIKNMYFLRCFVCQNNALIYIYMVF